jgi:predicted HicB family RNase H-like nuclease
MKKISKLLALLMFAVITFASCDSNKKASDKEEKTESFTDDAKTLARIDCELNKLSKDYDGNKDKIKELRRETEDMEDKYKKKVKDMSDNEKMEFKKKFQRAYEDEKDNCKD